MPDIETVYGKTEKFLDNLTSDHEKRIAEAVAQLEKKMMNLYQTTFSEGKGKFELAQAQALHKSLVNEIDKKYSATIEGITKEYVGMKDRIESDLSEFDIPVSFTKADMEALEGLRQSTTGQFSALGAAAEQKIAQSLYTAVVAGTDFATLTDTMRDALDTNMKKYAGLYAHDGLHQYYQTLNVKAAEKAGVDTFLWAGNLRTGSRAKCVESANKIFSRAEIDEMEKEQWDGKHKNVSVWIAVGGYHCHHHLIPYIDEEAIDEEAENLAPLKIETTTQAEAAFRKATDALESTRTHRIDLLWDQLSKSGMSRSEFEKWIWKLAGEGKIEMLGGDPSRLSKSQFGKLIIDPETGPLINIVWQDTGYEKLLNMPKAVDFGKTEKVVSGGIPKNIKKEKILAIVKSESRAESLTNIIDDNANEREIKLVIDGHSHINDELLSALEKTGYKVKFEEVKSASGKFNAVNNLATIGELHQKDYVISKTVAHEAGHAYDSFLSKIGSGTGKHGKYGEWKASALVTESEAAEYKNLFKKQLTGGTREIEGMTCFNGNFLDWYEGRTYGEATGIGEEFFAVNSSRYSDYILLKNSNKAKERLNEVLEQIKITNVYFSRKKTKAIEKALKLKSEKAVNDTLALLLSEWGEAKEAYPEFCNFLEALYSRKP